MTTIITAHEPQEFLAIVPELAGFRPVQSMVLVAFRGSRSCGALRVDLPPAGPVDADTVNAMASSLIGMLCKIPEVDAVVPVAYTAARFGAGSIPPHGELMNALIFHAGQSGFRVRDALCVAADGWASYFDTAVPRGGRALELIADARPPGAGRPAALDDQHGPALDESSADLATRQRIGRLLARFREMASDPAALGVPSAELDVLLGVPAIVESSLAGQPGELSDLHAAALLFTMQSPPSRDVLLLQFAFGAGAGLAAERENERFAAGEPGAGEQSARLLWGEGPRPDPERVEAAIALLLELVARSPRSRKPPPLTLLAWLNWALGRSSRAGVLLGMALGIDPGYGLAGLLDAMLRAGHVPEWAFAVPVERPAPRRIRRSAGRTAPRADRRAAR
ncbi:DUF4192 family protein [Microterricola viridarii]|uniref:DUF4192 domain-containing protein n=1 Tax=Microterricola viridarii TaxID=412690 RepID=A0A1H1RNF6_9MICO|nr:DUF4192 family protein [Microterricola viridarii]SDS37172.1 protein of unknown function [Microterricola viridarii]